MWQRTATWVGMRAEASPLWGCSRAQWATFGAQ